MTILPRFQLMLLLPILRHIQAMPTQQLQSIEWNASLAVMDNSNNITSNSKEYFETLALDPITMKRDIKDDFIGQAIGKMNNTEDTVTQEGPQEMNFWTGLQLFFTNDVRPLVEYYIPISKIFSIMKKIRQSNAWRNIRSFFINGYNRFAEMSEDILDEMGLPLNDE